MCDFNTRLKWIYILFTVFLKEVIIIIIYFWWLYWDNNDMNDHSGCLYSQHALKSCLCHHTATYHHHGNYMDALEDILMPYAPLWSTSKSFRTWWKALIALVIGALLNDWILVIVSSPCEAGPRDLLCSLDVLCSGRNKGAPFLIGLTELALSFHLQNSKVITSQIRS